MEKSAKLGWLMGVKMRLNGVANQFSHYVSLKGGIMTKEEMEYAHKLLEMISEIDAEGSKSVKNLANDLAKHLMR